MNPYLMTRPPRRWEAKLSPFLVRLTGWLMRRKAMKECQLEKVEVENAHIVKEALNNGCGVLITPNHPTHADAYSMNAASVAVGHPMYFMATWHVFANQGWAGQWLLQKYGTFSIDREGTDLEAMRMAQDILKNRRFPLVIFPEGEVYHTNDRVTPFREGAAALAYLAARRSERKIVCIPAALKYHYTSDPMPELLELTSELETAVHWRPTPEKPIVERLYRLGTALICLKELEYLDTVQEGTLTDRILKLSNHILRIHEADFEIDGRDKTIPERVKELRNECLKRFEGLEESDNQRRLILDKRLDDCFLAVQLYSYPGTYIAENPTVERIAETLDKLEEDVLDQYSATTRGMRSSIVRFGEPIEVPTSKQRNLISELTDQIEDAVQAMLDDINSSG
ncbi:MAG: 1-acyl-sn-glycerol-3-phosphate acyltransferase [Planctomycetes bacterium]|nr:1-acyl-sn-glycerol-3-phosphate acyltransferase [Planctomycetota bacterium]